MDETAGAPAAQPAPRTYHLTCRVDPYRDGWTLHRFLAARFRYHPPEIWEERIAGGAVRVNGTTAASATLVRKGDEIGYTVVHAEPVVDFRYEVLHEDEALLAVAKSGNIPVHAGGKFLRNTLVARLVEDRGERLRLAHRLDRETSGVVLVARTREAAAAMERAFRHRQVQKRYLAVVRGTPPEEMVIDAPIARREPARAPFFRVVAEGGKPSVTRFRRVRTGRSAASPHGAISLVEVVPESGRTNQIRVHAAHAGFPVLGDKLYGVPEALARAFGTGGPTPEIEAAAGAPRHLLHCAELAFAHPSTGETLRIAAPPPPDFDSVWDEDGAGS